MSDNKKKLMEERVNNLIVYIVNHLELGSLEEEEQKQIKDDVFKEITNIIMEISQVLIAFNEEKNIAIKRRKVLDFKGIIGSMVNNWGVEDLNLLAKLDEKKWNDFAKVLGGLARNIAQNVRDRSYFADLMPDDEQEDIIVDIEKQFQKVNHVINTDINELANNFDDYMDHTNKVVDMFEVKNFELREMLNNALYKLTEVRLSFAQMDLIGTNTAEEILLKKDIAHGAKKIAKQHGIINTAQIIRESKGY